MEENSTRITEINNRTPLLKVKQALGFVLGKIAGAFKRIVSWIFSISGYILIFGLICFIYWGIQPLQRMVSKNIKPKYAIEEITDEEKLNAYVKELISTTQQVQTKFNRLIPKENYMIINSSLNEFSLYKNKQVIRSGTCSTGSYVMLRKGEEQKWMFKTPKGIFTIKGKTTNPVWHKPDWAFVEEGLPIPPPHHSTRYEYGVLGDFALALGDGYMIHGTLYQRLLGLPVTHGCVRLGDADLEAVYKHLNIGSRVIIY